MTKNVNALAATAMVWMITVRIAKDAMGGDQLVHMTTVTMIPVGMLTKMRSNYTTAGEEVNHLYESNGVLHECEGARMISWDHGTYLVWTKCGKDVPADQSFKSMETANCECCASDLQQHTED